MPLDRDTTAFLIVCIVLGVWMRRKKHSSPEEKGRREEVRRRREEKEPGER